MLYAAAGNELAEYDLDRNAPALIRRSSVTVPANIQEAWPHPSGRYLYVSWSNRGGTAPELSGVSSFRIDGTSGALIPNGKPIPLPSRPIFATTDKDGTHLVVAYNDPSGLTVHPILRDGTVGPALRQKASLDFGIYGHQVRIDPSGRTVFLVTRGNGPTATRPEDPGGLKVFSYSKGVLTNRLSIAPGGGFRYQVRHMDFHPSGRWIYVTLERQNQIHVYPRMADGTPGSSPVFVRDTLAEPGKAKGRPSQTAASIHAHPNGRVVYVANRASDTVSFESTQVFAGGENSIAVFSINQETGEPTLIQSIDTQGFQPRTFSLDSGGSFLTVANQIPLQVRDGDAVRTVSANLALFLVGDHGKLDFVRKYDVETGDGRSLFWAGFVSLPW